MEGFYGTIYEKMSILGSKNDKPTTFPPVFTKISEKVGFWCILMKNESFFGQILDK